MKPEKKIELRNVVEGALLAAGRPLTLDELLALFPDDDRPDRAEMRKALDALQKDFEGRGIELKEVASGFRIQVRYWRPWRWWPTVSPSPAARSRRCAA